MTFNLAVDVCNTPNITWTLNHLDLVEYTNLFYLFLLNGIVKI